MPYIVPYIIQGCAKTWVFHQKPSPLGLTGLNWVLMGFMGKTQIPYIESELKNQIQKIRR